MTTFSHTVICIMLVALLASCGGDEPPQRADSSPTPSPTQTESIPLGQKYRSINAFATDLEKGGLRCDDLEILEQENPGLKDFALCDPDKDPLQRIDLYLFESTKGRDSFIASIVQTGLPWILGPNWIVVAGGEPTTAPGRIELVQRAIGGQIPNIQFETPSP